ncbi:MAG TPA: trehalose-6-phosphate synthase, partial [Acidimicrobiales bacterium]
MAARDVAASALLSPAPQLVVVANRLPIRLSEPGAHEWEPSPGGLASALTPVLRAHKGAWVGWSGETDGTSAPDTEEGIGLTSVPMSADEYAEFYLGFSNATLWPLYHDAVRSPSFHREWWRAYCVVNRRFASTAAAVVGPHGTVWVHDYQLQLVPAMLRELRPDVRIGFFLHIPFPPRELFMQLPWRRDLLAGLLGADLVGFQLPGAASNFSRLARRISGARGTVAAIEWEGRRVKVGAFPISVDVQLLEERAADPVVQARAAQIREELGDPETILLGVDRLDYTKGIDQRMRALAELYEDGTLDPARHVMVQVAVPTREEDPHYQDERRHLEQVVSAVNGDHSSLGKPVIHYLHQNMDLDELVAMYLAADVMLVTPYRDGMNLVAKEYV